MSVYRKYLENLDEGWGGGYLGAVIGNAGGSIPGGAIPGAIIGHYAEEYFRGSGYEKMCGCSKAPNPTECVTKCLTKKINELEDSYKKNKNTEIGDKITKYKKYLATIEYKIRKEEVELKEGWGGAWAGDVVGTTTGAIAGAIPGSIAGGPIGGIVGGVAGAAVGGIAGIIGGHKLEEKMRFKKRAIETKCQDERIGIRLPCVISGLKKLVTELKNDYKTNKSSDISKLILRYEKDIAIYENNLRKGQTPGLHMMDLKKT